MSKQFVPREKEVAALLKADASERFRYFIHKVADWGVAWGLSDDHGWVSSSDAEFPLVFPLWPAEAFARAAAVGLWADQRPTPIELHELVEKLMPKWIENGLQVGIFPLPSGRMVVLPVAEVRDALVEEASRTGEEFDL